jgi:hypothetical protein
MFLTPPRNGLRHSPHAWKKYHASAARQHRPTRTATSTRKTYAPRGKSSLDFFFLLDDASSSSDWASQELVSTPSALMNGESSTSYWEDQYLRLWTNSPLRDARSRSATMASKHTSLSKKSYFEHASTATVTRSNTSSV